MATERRNKIPSEVRVMSVEDFSQLETLDKRVEAMVENRNEIVIHNIEYILQQRNIAQAYMCNIDLEGTPQPPQMAVYKKVGKDIPFRTVARVAMAYGFEPEVLYGQLLDQTGGRGHAVDKLSPRPYDEYMKYIGTYYMAYFDTGVKLGGNKRTTARALSYGVLSIYPGNAVDGVPTLQVVAFSNCTEKEQNELIRDIRNVEAQGGERGIRACYEKVATVQDSETGKMLRMKCFYEGEMILTDRIAEITMRQFKGSDVVHINLHNRAAISSEGKTYKGGLATMMSVSRGEEHMPCVQAVILSKRGYANIAAEKQAKHLYLEPPKVDLTDKTKAIATYAKALFSSDNTDNPLAALGDEVKTSILENYIEKSLLEALKHNFLGYYKVSAEMDSDTYKEMCR